MDFYWSIYYFVLVALGWDYLWFQKFENNRNFHPFEEASNQRWYLDGVSNWFLLGGAFSQSKWWLSKVGSTPFQTLPEFGTDFFKHGDKISPSWWCWIVNSWKLKTWYCVHQSNNWRSSRRRCYCSCWCGRCYFRSDIAYFSTPNLKIWNCCVCRQIILVSEPKLGEQKLSVASYFMKTHHSSIYLKS